MEIHSGWPHTYGVYGQPKMDSVGYKKETTTNGWEVRKGIDRNLGGVMGGNRG